MLIKYELLSSHLEIVGVGYIELTGATFWE